MNSDVAYVVRISDGAVVYIDQPSFEQYRDEGGYFPSGWVFADIYTEELEPEINDLGVKSDYLSLTNFEYVISTVEIDQGKDLVRLRMSDVTDPYGVGFEQWIVVDDTDKVTASYAFSENLRGVVTPSDAGVVYLQDFNIENISDPINAYQSVENAIDLYSISSSSVEGWLTDLMTNPSSSPLNNIEHVVTLSQSDLAPLAGVSMSGKWVGLEAFVEASYFSSANSYQDGYAYLSILGGIDSDTDSWAFTRLSGDGSVISQTQLEGEFGNVRVYVNAEKDFGVMASDMYSTVGEFGYVVQLSTGLIEQVPYDFANDIVMYGPPAQFNGVMGTVESDEIGDSILPSEQWLMAFDGDDTLYSGIGTDYMVGGEGADKFIIASASVQLLKDLPEEDRSIDFIADFSTTDKLYLPVELDLAWDSSWDGIGSPEPETFTLKSVYKTDTNGDLTFDIPATTTDPFGTAVLYNIDFDVVTGDWLDAGAVVLLGVSASDLTVEDDGAIIYI
jgi:hypothetical protein